MIEGTGFCDSRITEVLQGFEDAVFQAYPGDFDRLPILSAAYFAQLKHEGQLDDDGNPYFYHVMQVYTILNTIGCEQHVLMAALLHDTIEDTDTTYEELVDQFGVRVADLVMEVTHEGEKDYWGYYFPRLNSREGILIKFADRLSNLTRMGSWPQKRQDQYLRKSKFWNSEGPRGR